MKIPFLFFIILFVVLIDFLTLHYFFVLTGRKKPRLRRRIIMASLPSVVFILMASVTLLISRNNIQPYYPFFFSTFAFFVLLYLPRLVYLPFGIAGDLFALFKLRKTRNVILFSGLPVIVIMELFILYGIFKGRDLTQTEYIEVKSERVPEAFNGFTIVQVSDWHLGSYGNDTATIAGHIRMLNSLPADMIFFTGDIVNNYASESIPFVSVFSQLKQAPWGNFAVLGNHDFSDYSQWENEEDKTQNCQQICLFLENAGFQILRNQNIPVVKGNDTLWLAGVDNWGLPPFKQYGDLTLALKNIRSGQPVILLSHNPSHWSHEVKDRKEIFLTLSGHTHGMQMGIYTKDFRWSPVQYLYPQWAGLYTENNQHLYVNRGIGFIGFSARMGMPPEITVITLVNK